MIKIGNIMVLSAAIGLSALSGCSAISGWFGSDDNLPSAPELLDNSKAQQAWYCYGKPDGSGWQCENKKTPSLITEIRHPVSRHSATKP